MLKVPNVNPNVTVTLNIGLDDSIAWGKYKHENNEHTSVKSIVDILEVPHKIARIIEQIQGMAYKCDLHHAVNQHYGYSLDVVETPVVHFRVAQSDTEATLVVQYEAVARDAIAQVFALADWLKQDCIAVYIHNPSGGGKGQLIGRYNYVWGEYDDKYFMHLQP